MHDDFDAEDQQPENIRDREIPGRAGAGGGRSKTPVRRSSGTARGSRSKSEMPEAAVPARALLETILTKMGVPHAEIEYIPRSEGEYFEVNGPDLAMLIGRHGNTLEALNLIFNNIINVGVRSNRRYYTIDAEGYRARRAEQLKSLALMVCERALREKKPQRMEPMLPSERKIVHIALQDNELARTESEGVEPERRVVIFPK
ncbi:MAG: single-stranded DNA-binding protein [Candidatus Eremiobacteraeota bacterium]|nr:single-stranded DNA-binding protein [Candidatus Eremiobacteraeota bacterium]